MRGWLLLPLLAWATPAVAAPITMTKSVAMVSDPMNNTVPRSIPGAVADYKTLASNPNSVLAPVRNIVLTETLPANVIFRVADIAAAGKGPVEFLDGSLLGTGLLGSGLVYTYSTSSPASDGLEFYDGVTWTYQPTADADGYDARVKAIRITLTSTFVAGTSFQLRYRVKIR